MTPSRHSPNKGQGVGLAQSDFLGQRSADRWESRPLADSVLHLIWHEQQISRAEIARRLGLSRSTVTEIIKELLQSGFVEEVGIGESSGGRRPIVLEFQNDARYVLGVEVGAIHVTGTLIDLSGKILVSLKRPHPVRTDPVGTRSLIIDIGKTCLGRVPRGSSKLLSIGVALPSPVDPNRPEFISEVVIPAWRGRTELDEIARFFDVPVFIDNDANLGALAEHRWGAGRGVEDLTYVKLAYGIGSGFILRGEIYRGASGIAGEMGHISINPEGPECVCGQRGCLATYVGGEALETRAMELLERTAGTRLRRDDLSLSKLEESALKDDPIAIQLYSEVTGHLSQAIKGWINMMNPSRIILGGSMARLGDRLTQPIQESINAAALLSSVASTPIRVGELGELAESVGAATLALEEVFAQPGFYTHEPRRKVNLAT